jgi:hypothetical protein
LRAGALGLGGPTLADVPRLRARASQAPPAKAVIMINLNGGPPHIDMYDLKPKGTPYRPQNVLATLYHLLGIDPRTTIPDHTGRPMYLLDDREPIAELLCGQEGPPRPAARFPPSNLQTGAVLCYARCQQHRVRGWSFSCPCCPRGRRRGRPE